jgi:hypothetical protein
MEFSLMEEFVLHKLFVEHCNLILLVSKRIQRLQIPKYSSTCYHIHISSVTTFVCVYNIDDKLFMSSSSAVLS